MDGSRRALVVDDDAQVLELASRMLASEGYDVVTVSDFERAKTLVRTESFRLLLADVRLREFNGLQLVIEARLGRPDTPIIVVTGWDDVALRDDAAGFKAVILRKPFTADALRDAIESAASAVGA